MNSIINFAPLERFSANPDLQRRLIHIYLDTTRELMANITACSERGDVEQLAFHAHSLKGMSFEIGADRVAELSQQLQQAARAGEKEAIEPLVTRLYRSHEEADQALRALDLG